MDSDQGGLFELLFDEWLVEEALKQPDYGPVESSEVEFVLMYEGQSPPWRQLTLKYSGGKTRVSYFGPEAWEAIKKLGGGSHGTF